MAVDFGKRFGLGMARAVWSKDDTQAYLKANPLPREFKWLHRDHQADPEGGMRTVQPSHASVANYGKWLRETPYFPGLFELVHEVLAGSHDLGDADWLAEQLNAKRADATRALF